MPWHGPSAAGSALQQVPGLTHRGEGEEEEVAHITSHTPPIQQSPVWRGEGEEWRGGGGGEVDGTMKSPVTSGTSPVTSGTSPERHQGAAGMRN